MRGSDLAAEKPTRMSFRFADFELDPDRFELRNSGSPVKVEPQTFSLILYLVQNRNRLVTKADLHAEIWQGRAISDWAISAGIKSARAALGDTSHPHRFIRTVHGKGVRFVAKLDREVTPQNGLTSLGIVPFENLSGDPSQDYLADGITEDLITDLTRIRDLTVASRNASFSLAKQRLPIEKIAERLRVAHVLEGSVRRHGTALRINVQMVETETGHQLWTERFDGTGDDIFTLQDDITARIVSALKLRLSNTSPRRGTRNPEAYDQCLRGRSEYYQYAPPHMAKALAFFENAAEIDPNYAEAYAYQSYCHAAIFVFAWPGANATLDRAEELAVKAIKLDPTSAVAHARLGWVQGFTGQTGTAITSFETAVECDPENAEVFFAYGETMNRLGQPDRALALIDKAFAIESFVPPSWGFGKGHAYALLRDYDKALDNILPVLERVPQFIPARVQLARIYVEMGASEDARAAVDKITEFAPNYRMMNAGRMFPYPDAENRDRLSAALTKAGLADGRPITRT